MIRLLAEERATVAQYIHSLCAIALDETKDYLIESRLGALVEESGCRNYLDLVQRARFDASGTLRKKIVNLITTGETLFFRDSAPFNLLRFKLIPDIIDRRSRVSSIVSLRIWSAACSTGQEIYSVAIVLADLLGDLSRYNIRLVGTDISEEAIAKASAGVFSHLEVARGLTEPARTRYFQPDPGGWKIRPALRNLVTFRRLNLTQDFSGLGKFDIILCRNVAIYFSEPDRLSLFQRLEQRLENQGYLIVGSMESLNGICPRLESKLHHQAAYYQLACPVSAPGAPCLTAVAK